MKYEALLKAALQINAGELVGAADTLRRLSSIPEKLGYRSSYFGRAFTFNGVGKIFEEARLPEEAESIYRAALEYNPHFALALFNLGRLLSTMER